MPQREVETQLWRQLSEQCKKIFHVKILVATHAYELIEQDAKTLKNYFKRRYWIIFSWIKTKIGKQ